MTMAASSLPHDEFVRRLQTALGAGLVLECELVRGGSARVFKAHELRLGREVVVKAFAPVVSSAEAADRFEREVRIMSRLQHPHILPLLTAGGGKDVLWYSMPCVEGESLRTRLAMRRTLPLTEAARLLRDIACGLAFAHRSGFVHRDIKPENILLSDGIALLIDFGIARILDAFGDDDDPETARLTRPHLAVGTLPYMAPEQLLSQSTVEAGADLYALGCVGYEMLTGAPPFAHRSDREMPYAHQIEVPQPIRERRPESPSELNALLEQCLCKMPEERPANADRVVQLLDAVLSQVITADHTPGAASLFQGGAMNTARSTERETSATPTLLILPFETNANSDVADMFADGFTDELIASLGRTKSLRVIGRAVAFSMKGRRDDPRVLARRVNADLLVAGSVRLSGEKLRIAVEVSDAKDGKQQWSQSFDRVLGDLFDVQDEVASKVARLITGNVQKLPPEVEGRERRPRTAVPATAMLAFMQGLRVQREAPSNIDQAAAHFADAITHAPQFARAHAASASILVQRALHATGIVPAKLLAHAEAAARAATAIDPDTQGVRAVLGACALVGRWSWHEARALFAEVLDDDASQPIAAPLGALLEVACGRYQSARTIIARGYSPWLDSSWRQHMSLMVDRLAGDYPPDALRLRADPERLLARPDVRLAEVHDRYSADALREIALAMLAAADTETAHRVARLALEASGEGSRSLAVYGLCCAHLAHVREAQAIARRLALSFDGGAVPVAEVAMLRWQLGEPEAAEEWLGRAMVARDPGVLTLGVDPMADAFRLRPRVASMLAAMFGFGGAASPGTASKS